MLSDLEGDLDLALRLADTADAVSMRHFTGGPIEARLKADGTPVTVADIAVERRLAAIVADERPGDGMVGEEIGVIPGTPGLPARPARRWIVDGIDGTVLFAAGNPGWGTQIALEVGGEVVVGVSTCPASEGRWWASSGGGAWRSGRGGVGPVRLGVSTAGGVGPRECRASVIPAPERLTGVPLALAERLGETARFVAHATPHGALAVAEGVIEACLQPIGGPWDFAALTLVVEEAGGRYSDLAGGRDIYGGGPVLYSNGLVHEALATALTVPA